ncbi:putative ABC transporter permease [Olegusella massiliensis]|uniref:putative ABC transporter permease n=1 Tax=Olegusella massiliensis TaxID=1776381 RepID=UPI0003ADFDA5|nr:putative ABC transporter permease [Olegusella massiliensis]ERL12108.1 PF06541 family protein [Coriobacteriaceae bacterium BV3Ac1]
MLIARSFITFLFFSFCGWLWETFFCTVHSGSFQSRGFLFGPICPIYGVGVLSAQFTFAVIEKWTGTLPLLQTFVICVVGGIVIEYATSWYLEQRFNARWWDYSHMPLNIHGRICLPVSLIFGAAGSFALRIALPWFASVESLLNPLVLEVISLVAAAIFGADFALTEAVLSELQMKVKDLDNELTQRGERMYQVVAGAPSELKAKVSEVGAEAKAVMEAGGDQLVTLASDSKRSVSNQMTKAVLTLTYWQQDQLQRMRSVQPSSWVGKLKDRMSKN